MDAGILPEAIDVLTARPLDVDGTIQTGDWVADICMISASGLPNTINPKGSLVTDNLFTSDLAKRDVIDRDGFLDDVAAARSISDEEAYKLYEQFLAASVLATETGAIVDEISGGQVENA